MDKILDKVCAEISQLIDEIEDDEIDTKYDILKRLEEIYNDLNEARV